MIAGPIPLRIVAILLGKDESAMPAVIKEDGLPAVSISSETKAIDKVFFGPLLTWLNARAKNVPMTAEQLEAELARCETALKVKIAQKKQRRTAKQKEAA